MKLALAALSRFAWLGYGREYTDIPSPPTICLGKGGDS